MSLTWDLLDRYFHEDDDETVTAVLLAADETERLAFAAELTARIRAEREDVWRRPPHPGGLYALAVIACAPSAARAADLLSRRELRRWDEIPVDRFLEIVRARGLTWTGDLGVRLCAKIPSDGLWPREWRFVAALLDEGRAEPPVTEGVVRSWLDALIDSRLAESTDVPFLHLLLPAVFEIDGLGSSVMASTWDSKPGLATVVTWLIEDGRIDRAKVLEMTVDRLVRGDRPASLREFATLHEALAPAPGEMAAHIVGYARVLGSATSAVAGLAQRCLRTVDDAGLLPVETLLEASAEVLVRTERTLVKAQLTWLGRVARRAPDRVAEIAETAAVAFGHPALDVQERALDLVARVLPGSGAGLRDRLAVAAEALTGDLRHRATTLLGADEIGRQASGSTAGPTTSAAIGAPGPVTMPPPIGGAAELAEEVSVLFEAEDAVRWERVLAGLVTVHRGGDTAALGPLLDRHDNRYPFQPKLIYLLEAVRVLLGRPERDDDIRWRMAGVVQSALPDSSRPRSSASSPADLLPLRIGELALRQAEQPVPLLLATPTDVTGAIDAGVLVDRLARLEAAGLTPWPIDFEQALLRVRPAAGTEVTERAAALTSARGRQLAAWLAAGGMPDPVSSRKVQCNRGPDGEIVMRRVLTELESTRTGHDGLRLEGLFLPLRRADHPRYFGDRDYRPDILAMALPRHREVIAAWALPDLAGLADQDARDASLLPLLADAGGPAGPAMTLAVTYGLAARHEADRIAAVDAFLLLASETPPASAEPSGAVPPPGAGLRDGAAAEGADPEETPAGAAPGSFAARVGAELGDLSADGTIKLSRAVSALAGAHQAGASAAVWEVLTTALALLLRTAPRGLPDMIELATRVAGALGVRATIPGLAEAAGRPGSSRLTREAKRLHATVTR
ncbi:hypothetical protein FHR83_007274 [Actinoplanes campanulatus]|uniref:Secreted protein n=1 Tax=Actinoplanes campanulatus TaxID=113559 RepID=A0A7W5FII6_9ACTN|nr:DUF6493 family protein [Actinoplanes campanulatus]MBB3099567.1 hypothetical protein [Actinoplanes campanulatus]GGN42206.1 hypothetical protein GCM10010109_73120 [Actinoplanes campanulatus]GID39917.1 hypothetical protein Aca09nite_64230 [Actinoplanes campanulatus]